MMKPYRFVIAASACSLFAACSNVSSLDPSALVQSGQLVTQAATLSDADVRTLTDKSCAQLDSENTIAPANSKYQKRLNKIAAQLGDNINGTPVNYKVYIRRTSTRGQWLTVACACTAV